MTQTLPFQLDKPALFHDKSLVNGAWIEAKSGERFEVIDPGTGKTWAAAPNNDVADVDVAVRAAHQAFLQYRKQSPRVRGQCLVRWGDLIRQHRNDLAKIVTYETGKPLAESQGEVEYALAATWWFGGEAERIQGTVFDSSVPGKKVLTIKQPIGVAAALIPWNFPIAMFIRKAAAALAAGCTMVVKPSPETPLSALTLANLAEEAGIPPGVLNVLPTSLERTPAVSEALCRHPLIRKVTFTGSTRVGKLVARLCSDGLKKVTLELGGNCPFVVFDDADLEEATTALMGLKWRNSGQACISANRVYVQAGVYQQFAEMLRERSSKLVVGHGISSSTTMGPLTTPQSVDRALALVEDAKSRGARISLGGHKVDDASGFFFEPTIILDADEKMAVTQEETFAPIVTMCRFETEEEAVEAANNTSMGLASYVFTKNIDRAWTLMEDLEAGIIGLNTSAVTGAESPFGGMKESGYGKEAGKNVAVEEYLVTKSASLALASRL